MLIKLKTVTLSLVATVSILDLILWSCERIEREKQNTQSSNKVLLYPHSWATGMLRNELDDP